MRKLMLVGLLVTGWMFAGTGFASAHEYHHGWCGRPVYHSYCEPVRTYCPPVEYCEPVRTYCPPVRTCYTSYDYDCAPVIDWGYGC